MKPKQTIKLKQFSALLLLLLLSWTAFAQSPTQVIGTGQILQDYNDYLQKPGHKAFVTTTDGAYAWAYNSTRPEVAVRDALNRCQNAQRQRQSDVKCVVADINGQLFGVYSEAETHFSSHSAVEAYKGSYTNSQNHKVFVQSPSGRWSWRGNRNSLAEAESDALEACNEGLAEGQEPCVVINRNGQFVNSN